MTEIPWTFLAWIANFKSVDLPIGDLARDIASDPEFPDDDDFYSCLDYLACKCNYDSNIIDIFRVVWDFYISSTR